MAKGIRALRDDIVGCVRCPRLREHCREVARHKRRAYRDWEYWGKPVPGFGSTRARLVLVGLAPGAHGANRTGRMFTGDSSGDFLYGALHRYGFASQPTSTSKDDGLRLLDCYITNAVRCAPPGNKPTRAEQEACAPFLHEELGLLRHARVFVALGRLGFHALWKAVGCDTPYPEFGHARRHELPGRDRLVVCSYHPSRQNTQTGRLTAAMFDRVFAYARDTLEAAPWT